MGAGILERHDWGWASPLNVGGGVVGSVTGWG